MLSSAGLPQPNVALAVIILDSLTPRFATTWRKTLPLTSLPEEQRHIDLVRPEIIVLTALMIADKFLEDEQMSGEGWREVVAGDRWGKEMIRATEHAILDNLGHRLMPLWKEELLEEAIADMERCEKRARHRRMLSVSSTGSAASSKSSNVEQTEEMETPRPVQQKTQEPTQQEQECLHQLTNCTLKYQQPSVATKTKPVMKIHLPSGATPINETTIWSPHGLLTPLEQPFM
jgi:hypothetical protein